MGPTIAFVVICCVVCLAMAGNQTRSGAVRAIWTLAALLFAVVSILLFVNTAAGR